MNWGRAWAIALKVFRSLRRDKRALALMMLAPVLQMMVIGFVFGATLSNVTTVVVNQDRGPAGAALLKELNHTLLDVHVGRSVKAAQDEVKAATAWAAIVIPPGFSDALSNPRAPASIQVSVDGSNSQVVAAIDQDLARALRALAPPAASPIQVSQSLTYGEGAKYIDFFIAALMGFAVFNFTAITTVTAFVTERTTGMLDRLRATPIASSEIVAGHAVAYGMVGTIQGSLVLATAVLFYGIKVEGPVWLAFLVVVLLAIASQALGMLLSAAAKRESQAIQMVPLIIIPAFVVSGTFVPIFSLPVWLRPLAYVIPIYWSSEALRSVLLRGWGLDRVWPHVLVLVLFAALFLGLSVLLLERQRR
ncbi:MAG: ABC transporter permease [Thermoplasmatota archaeon]